MAAERPHDANGRRSLRRGDAEEPPTRKSSQVIDRHDLDAAAIRAAAQLELAATASTRSAPHADPEALEVVRLYKVAISQGEHRILRLAGADLRDVDLSGVRVDECDLSGSVLDGARFVGASLIRANLAGASIVGADFSYAILDHSDLEGVDATAAAFMNATLSKCNLIRSRLRRSNLSEANLNRANLFEANLSGADLSRAQASQANLQGAILEDTILTGLRGEPLLDDDPATGQRGGLFGWPAVRLGEQQLASIAESYLAAQGWGLLDATSANDAAVDLMAHRGDITLLIQVKATAPPSTSTFVQIAEHLWRIAGTDRNAHVLLVMPGPVPERLRAMAEARRMGVLGIWIEPDSSGMRVEEVVRPAA